MPASFLIRRAVHDDPSLDPIRSGEAPGFTLPAIGGGTVSLDGLRGRPVVVNFWGTWCEQCERQIPVLAAAEEDHPEVAVVGILFRDDPEAAREAARRLGADWPTLLDPDGAVAAEWGVHSAPVTFFVARDGTVAGHLVGPVHRRLVERQLERIL